MKEKEGSPQRHKGTKQKVKELNLCLSPLCVFVPLGLKLFFFGGGNDR
jgi:hypothetical protein